MSNAYCEALPIDVPSLEAVKNHREANTYALLIVALLERGSSMTLGAVAERFEAAGIAPAPRALLSLQRCRRARPPVYRDGARYALDRYADELAMWAVRLGLRPPAVPALRLVRPAPEPVPPPDQPLAVQELAEAWRGVSLSSWSAQRVANRYWNRLVDETGIPLDSRLIQLARLSAR